MPGLPIGRMDGLFANAHEMVKGREDHHRISSPATDGRRTAHDVRPNARERSQCASRCWPAIKRRQSGQHLPPCCGKEAQQQGPDTQVNIVKAVAQVTGGNGGGKPDFAMAGAKDLTKMDEALAAVEEFVAKMLAK